jgi:hypothetical protein
MKLLTSCWVGVGLAVMASAGAPTVAQVSETAAHVSNHVSNQVNTGDPGVGNRGGSSGGGTGGSFVVMGPGRAARIR